MPTPVVVGAGISALGSLLGGAFGSSSASSNTKRMIAYQKEFAQHGIRWRVDDARAAGLHPLYALGAQTPSFTPVHQTDHVGPAIAEAGQNIGRAVAAALTPEEKQMQLIQLETARANLREGDARAGLLESELAMRRQSGAIPIIDPDTGFKSFPMVDMPSTNALHVESDLFGRFANLPQADSTVSNENFPHSMWTGFRWKQGAPPIMLPGGLQGDPAEALESLAESPVLMWIVYQENKQRHGAAFTDAFFNRYFGKQGESWGTTLKKKMEEAIGSRWMYGGGNKR